MPLRRASPSISTRRGFFAPASSSTSRTLSASCSTAADTALIPAIHCLSLPMAKFCHASGSVLLFLALGGLAAGRGWGRGAGLSFLDEAEVDAAVLDAGLQHDDRDAVAQAIFLAPALAGQRLPDRVEVVVVVRQLGHVHQAVHLRLVEFDEQAEAG